MAYTTIDDPRLHFQSVLFAGNGSGASSTQSITLGGDSDMQPDLVWFKKRDGAEDHELFDSIRGVQKALDSNNNNAEATGRGLTAFNSNGFTVGNGTDSGNQGATNEINKNFVCWCWKAGGSASSDSNGDITSSVSANTTAGFSIVSYTGNASSNQTVGHGLGGVPQMIISKNRDNTSTNYNDWIVYHHSNATANDTKLKLNTTDDASSTNEWGDTDPTSTVYSVHTGGDGATNDGTDKIISYCFRGIKGFSKFGKYRANDTDTTAAGGGAPFIYTGFRPAFIVIKRLGANSWCMYDDRRGGNDENPYVEADSTVAEQTNGEINICSNGFKLDDSGTEINYSTNEYLYWAIARHPFVSSKGVPTTAGTGNIVDGG